MSDSITEIPLQDVLPEGVQEIPIRPPTTGEVLLSAAQQPGLSFIRTAGGLLRGAGDLARSRTLEDLGAEIYKNAAGATEMVTPAGMDLPQQVAHGAIQSVGEMFPYLAAAALTGGTSAIPAIAGAAITTGADKYGELRAENFSGSRSAFHAGIDGIAEALGEKLSLPVLFKGGQPFMKKLGEFMTKELVGEEFTTIAQQANALLSNRPDMTWGEFLDGIKMTALVTPFAAGGQAAIHSGIAGARNALRPDQATIPSGNPAAPVAPITPVTPTGMKAESGVTLLPLEPKAPEIEEFELKPSEPEGVTEPAAPEPQEPDIYTSPLFKPERGLKLSENSPDDMVKAGQVDPMLYLGLPTKEGVGKVGMYYEPSQGWQMRISSITSGETLAQQFFATPEPLVAALKEITGIDLLNNREVLNQLHFSNMITAARHGDDISNSNLAYYGDGLTQLRNHYTLEPEGASRPLGPMNSQWAGSFVRSPAEIASHLGYMPVGEQETKVEIRGINDKEYNHGGVFSQLRGIDGPPSTYIMQPQENSGGLEGAHIRDSFTTEALAKRVEVWRSTFAPDMKVVVGSVINDPVNNGKMLRMADGTFIITYNKARQSSRVDAFTTMSHEFGHALIMHQLLKTEPKVALKFINDWMLVRARAIGNRTTKLERFARYGGVNRITSSASAGLDATGEISPEWSRYQIGFDEYMADQVSQYLYDENLIFDKDQQSFLDQVVQILKDFYDKVAHKFSRAPGFHNWMENLKNGTQSRERYVDRPTEPDDPAPRKKTKVDVSDLDFTLPKKDNYKWEISTNGDYRDVELSGWKYTASRNDKGSWDLTAEDGDTNDFDSPPDFLGTFSDFESLEAEVYEHQKQVKSEQRLQGVSEDQQDLDAKIISALRKYGFIGAKIIDKVEIKRYVVKDTHTGEVRGNYKIRGQARAKEDALNLEYGAHRYSTDTTYTIDRTRAWEFLELMGEDTTKYMDSTQRDDDTTLFRGSVSNLLPHFPDMAQYIGRSNESVKSFNWFLQKTLTAVQLRKRFGDMVPGLKNFVDQLERMHAYKSRWKSRADDRIKEMRGVGKKQREAVFQLLMDEDERGTYFSESKKIDDGAGNTKHIRVLSKEVADKYGITEQGAKLYTDLIEDFRGALDELEELAKQELYRTYSQDTPESQRALQEAIMKLEVEFAQMRSKPYVPHTRFGEFTVTVLKDGKVSEFHQFESERDAKVYAERRRKQGDIASAGKLREDVRSFIGLPSNLISSMKSSLNLTGEQIKEFEELMKNLSSGQSFVRRMKERKNIPGYVDEAESYPRVYADYFSRFSNHAARLKFNYQLNESESNVRKQIRGNMESSEDSVNLTNLLNWMQRTHEWAVAPRSEWAHLRAAVTLWYLGFNVKSAFVNAMSVPMVTAPYLSSRFGWAKTAPAVSAAYRDLARHYSKAGTLTADELKMIANLREMGILDESFSAELAGIREAGKLTDITSMGALKAGEYKMKYYGMWMFHKMELVNRYATALAAYRLAREQTTFDPSDIDGFDKKARTFAKQAVQDTQNENAQWNRSEMMRGGKSVLTMFMQYQQNLIYQMFGGDQSWMRLLAVQLMLAGMMGLPFAKDLDNLIKWFARKVFGTDESIDKAVRAYLEDTFLNPDILLKGASHNVFGADLQGSLSLGQVVPGLDALAMEGNFPDRLANAAGDVGGAGASVILEFMKAIASNDPSTINRFMRTMPTAAKNAMQGYNMLATGSATNSQGDTVAEATQSDSIMKMLGVQPTAVSDESQLRFVQKDAAKFWLTRREYVLAKYYRAVQQHDADAMSAAREDLLEFNSEVPSPSLRLDAKTVRQSLLKRLRGDVLTEHDLPVQKNMRDLYAQTAQLYGR